MISDAQLVKFLNIFVRYMVGPLYKKNAQGNVIANVYFCCYYGFGTLLMTGVFCWEGFTHGLSFNNYLQYICSLCMIVIISIHVTWSHNKFDVNDNTYLSQIFVWPQLIKHQLWDSKHN